MTKKVLKGIVTSAKNNKTIVSFSRKTKEYFITSEKDKKSSSWRLTWSDGKWVENKK